jgi:hypothetical protein
VDPSGVTSPISAASLPLPTGAATEATISTLNGKVPANLTVSSTRLLVDGSGVTQPVSGTVTVNAGTNLDTSALALESGGNLAGVRTDLGTDGTSPPTLPGGSTGVRGWLRYLSSLLPGLGTAGSPSSNVISVQGVASGTAQPVSAASLPLPSGASTETTLSTLNGKVPTLSLGAQAATASLAVTPANKVTVTGPAGQSSSNVDLLTGNVSGWYDAAAFNFGSFTIIGSAGIASGQVTLEGTNDASLDASGASLAWIGATGANNTTGLFTSISISANTVNRYQAVINTRYIRVRISTPFSGGTVQCVAVLSQVTPQPPNQPQNTSLNLIAGGAIASRGASVGTSPLVIGGRGATAAPTAVTNGQVVDPLMTVQGHQVVRPWQIPELSWFYIAASGGIINTSDVNLATAAGAGLRRYIVSAQVSNNSATPVELVFKDGASTVLSRHQIPANMPNIQLKFEPPLFTSANAVPTAATSGSAAVFVNVQGFTAP